MLQSLVYKAKIRLFNWLHQKKWYLREPVGVRMLSYSYMHKVASKIEKRFFWRLNRRNLTSIFDGVLSIYKDHYFLLPLSSQNAVSSVLAGLAVEIPGIQIGLVSPTVRTGRNVIEDIADVLPNYYFSRIYESSSMIDFANGSQIVVCTANQLRSFRLDVVWLNSVDEYRESMIPQVLDSARPCAEWIIGSYSDIGKVNRLYFPNFKIRKANEHDLESQKALVGSDCCG